MLPNNCISATQILFYFCMVLLKLHVTRIITAMKNVHYYTLHIVHIIYLNKICRLVLKFFF